MVQKAHFCLLLVLPWLSSLFFYLLRLELSWMVQRVHFYLLLGLLSLSDLFFYLLLLEISWMEQKGHFCLLLGLLLPSGQFYCLWRLSLVQKDHFVQFLYFQLPLELFVAAGLLKDLISCQKVK